MNITIEFFMFELVLVPIFSLNWQLQFLDQICRNELAIFSLKQIK